MKIYTLVAIVAAVIIVTAGVGFVLLNNNSSKEVVDIITDDPNRETADANGRLWIVGNANMDDVLDEKDIEWIQKILDGKANEVVFNAELSKYSVDVRMADANQDGVINNDDIKMVRSMIDANINSEKQLIHYIDVDGAINSMHYPAKTLISTYEQNSKQIQTLHALDMLIAWDYQSAGHAYAAGALKDDQVIFHSYSERSDPSAELIIKYAPDAILTGTRDIYCNTLEAALPSERSNMDVIRISSWEDNKVIEGTLTLGFMICKNEEAQAYAAWADKWIGTISDKVSTLSDDKIVKILVPRGQYVGWEYIMNGPRSGKYETSLLAGADNVITRNLTSTSTNVTVTDEWVKAQSDLDYIVAIVYGGLTNVKMNDYTNKSFYDAAVKHWAGMTNAYGTQIHVLDNLVGQGTSYVIGSVYMAKWFYPDLFKDMNPDEIFQEFMDDFLQYDFDVAAYQATGGIAI